MSDPLPASQIPSVSFSQGVDANSPAQFNLSFPPPSQTPSFNDNINTNYNYDGSSMSAGQINPQSMYQNGNTNGNFQQQQNGMNGQMQGMGMDMASASFSNGNQSFDPAALQARIAHAQQMAHQAGLQQHTQQEQKGNGQHGPGQNQGQGQAPGQGQHQGHGHERKASGSSSGPGGAAGTSGDWAQLANPGTGGIMPNAQATTREALMKQVSSTSRAEL